MGVGINTLTLLALLVLVSSTAAGLLLVPHIQLSKAAVTLKENLLVPPTNTLGWSIYEQYSTLLPIYKQLYATATSSDLLIDDAWTPKGEVYVGYWDTPQVFPRMILANNISELESFTLPEAAQFNFASNDYVGYDAEKWSLTPLKEQNNQSRYTQLACEDVHDSGYKFAYTPEIDVNGWGQFAEINWTCVNLLDLQEQFMSSNTVGLVQNVTQMLAASKGINPNLSVFVQLNMSVGEDTTENDITALAGIQGVNGVIIQDLCKTQACNSTLVSLVGYIQTIDGLTSTTTSLSTTTITTTTSTTVSTVMTTLVIGTCRGVGATRICAI